MYPDQSLITSYVWHHDRCFFVSTIERDSSSLLSYGDRYTETIVWEFDWETKTRGALVGMTGGSRGSITKHLLMCQRLFDTGSCEEEQDEDN